MKKVVDDGGKWDN